MHKSLKLIPQRSIRLIPILPPLIAWPHLLVLLVEAQIRASNPARLYSVLDNALVKPPPLLVPPRKPIPAALMLTPFSQNQFYTFKFLPDLLRAEGVEDMEGGGIIEAREYVRLVEDAELQV